jgi:hypothetical protein
MCDIHSQAPSNILNERQNMLLHFFSVPERSLPLLKYNEFILPIEENKELIKKKKFIKKLLSPEQAFTKCN